MEKHERNLITENLLELVNNTEYNTTCIAVLMENGVFGADDLSHLKSIPDERKRVLEFYQLIMRKADSYGHLITAMNKSSQSRILEIQISKFQELKSRLIWNGKIVRLHLLSLHQRRQLHFIIFNVKNMNTGISQEKIYKPIRFDVLDHVRLFTGRVEELKELHKKLQQSGTKVTHVSQMVSIVGLGGIGKTELARMYIQKFVQEYDNNAIWINAETEDTVTESFRRFATDCLQLSTLNVDGNEKQITSIIDDVYNFLNGRQSLFVFDNAESNEQINKFMPIRVTDKPYLLITSREKDWSFSMEMLELHEMEKMEAHELVKRGLQIQEDSQDESIFQLIERLQYFPLAMSQAIHFIQAKLALVAFDIDDYLKAFESCSEWLLNSGRPAAELNSYTLTTLTTWKVTTDLISSFNNYGSQAMLMLNKISYFYPDKIPINILLFNDRVTKTSENEKQQNEDALSLLVKYSMVNIQPLHKTISIHRLVQEVTRNQLKETKMEEEVLSSAMKVFSRITEWGHVNHAYSVFKYCAAYMTLTVEYKGVPTNILMTFSVHGGSPYAFNIASKLKDILLKYVSSEDVDVIRLEMLLLNLEYEIGSFESSFKKLTRILPFYLENKFGLFHELEIIQIHLQLAHILKELGRRVESIEIMLQSYEKLKVLKGVNDYQTVGALVDIANCLFELGHFSERPPMNTTYLQLLSEDFKTNDPQKIILLLKTAYENNKHLVGSNYSYSKVLFQVAQCLNDLGDKDTAYLIANYGYETERNSPDSRIQTNAIRYLNHIANMKTKEGNHEEAFQKYHEAHTLLSSKLGHSHPNTLILKRNMLVKQRELGQSETVLEAFQDVLKTALTYYPDSLLKTRVELDIAVTLYETKRYNESLALLLDLKTKILKKFPQIESLMSEVNYFLEIVQRYVDLAKQANACLHIKTDEIMS